jgi:hypothetical protein
MSLRKVHIFFISISSLLCLGLIFWGLWEFKRYGILQGLAYSGIGAAGVAILLGYLKWFLKKYPKLMSLGLAALWGAFCLSASPALWACSVCYQDPDSPLTLGTMTGVLFLLAVIVALLFSIVLVARSWVKRAKALNLSL